MTVTHCTCHRIHTLPATRAHCYTVIHVACLIQIEGFVCLFDCSVNDLVYLVLELFILVEIGLWLNSSMMRREGSWSAKESRQIRSSRIHRPMPRPTHYRPENGLFCTVRRGNSLRYPLSGVKPVYQETGYIVGRKQAVWRPVAKAVAP